MIVPPSRPSILPPLLSANIVRERGGGGGGGGKSECVCVSIVWGPASHFLVGGEIVSHCVKIP